MDSRSRTISALGQGSLDPPHRILASHSLRKANRSPLDNVCRLYCCILLLVQVTARQTQDIPSTDTTPFSFRQYCTAEQIQLFDTRPIHRPLVVEPLEKKIWLSDITPILEVPISWLSHWTVNNENRAEECSKALDKKDAMYLSNREIKVEVVNLFTTRDSIVCIGILNPGLHNSWCQLYRTPYLYPFPYPTQVNLTWLYTPCQGGKLLNPIVLETHLLVNGTASFQNLKREGEHYLWMSPIPFMASLEIGQAIVPMKNDYPDIDAWNHQSLVIGRGAYGSSVTYPDQYGMVVSPAFPNGLIIGCAENVFISVTRGNEINLITHPNFIKSQYSTYSAMALDDDPFYIVIVKEVLGWASDNILPSLLTIGANIVGAFLSFVTFNWVFVVLLAIVIDRYVHYFPVSAIAAIIFLALFRNWTNP